LQRVESAPGNAKISKLTLVVYKRDARPVDRRDCADEKGMLWEIRSLKDRSL
jgi:hypothetical protein